MRLACWVLLPLGIGALAAGCTSDLKLALEGKRCSAEGRCVAGYECDARANLCVLGGSIGHDGGLGGSSLGGSGDAGRGGGSVSIGGSGGNGAGGGGSPGGSVGSSGSPGVGGVGGAIIPNDPDGGADDEPDADGGCVPTTVYRDADGDTFGVADSEHLGCPGPGWATRDGDCNDDERQAFPGQTIFFSTGYASPSPAPGGVSFDYNCSSGEEPESARNTPVPTNCDTLLGLGCSDGGFEDASPARNGVGVEPRCGSNVYVHCYTTMAGSCDSMRSTLVQSEAFGCR